MTTLEFQVSGEKAMVAFGQKLGGLMNSGALYLFGDLGAGKTTLCRGIMRSFGHKGAVKSPTYTLVEPYQFPSAKVFHFDLYRLADAEELEYMGIRDYFAAENLCIVEWPERGEDILPEPDIEITIGIEREGRVLALTAHGEKGEQILNKLGRVSIEH